MWNIDKEKALILKISATSRYQFVTHCQYLLNDSIFNILDEEKKSFPASSSLPLLHPASKYNIRYFAPNAARFLNLDNYWLLSPTILLWLAGMFS